MKHPTFFCIANQISEEDFTILYNNHDLTIKDLAQQFNVHTTTVHAYVRHLKLPRRHHCHFAHKARVVDGLPDVPWWISEVAVELIKQEMNQP